MRTGGGEAGGAGATGAQARGDGHEPASGGRARRRRADGAASRARLLEAAGRLFATQGYATVSTRALAKAGRVNLSAIGYHFGGKQGLYRAVLRRLIADTDPILVPADERHLLGSILAHDRMRWQMGLMLREFHQPSVAFPMLLDERIHPLHDAVAGLVAAATGGTPAAPETRLLTAALIGQCMGFGIARTVVCARLGWDRYTPERVELIIRSVTPAVLAMLGLPGVSAPTERVAP